MSFGSLVIDLDCAQLHPSGCCRMMMVVHVVDAGEHDLLRVARRNCACQRLRCRVLPNVDGTVGRVWTVRRVGSSASVPAASLQTLPPFPPL